MKLHYTAILIAELILCTSAAVVAQQPSTKQGVPTGLDPTVEIVTDYKGKLLETDKIDIAYNTNDSILNPKIKFTYPFIGSNMRTLFLLEPISAISLCADDLLLSDVGYGYFRAGFMHPMAPEVDLYLHSPLSRISAVSIYLKHRSFWGKSPLYEQTPAFNRPFTNEILSAHETTQAGVELQHINKRVTINVKSEYRHQSLLYHGQDTLFLKTNVNGDNIGIAENDFVKKFMRQTFNIFKNEARVYTPSDSNKTFSLNLGAHLDYIRESAHCFGYRATRQYTTGLDGFLNWKMGVHHAFNLQLFAQAYNRDNTIRKLTSGLFNVTPSYALHTRFIEASAGVNIEGVYTGHGTNFNLYPFLTFHGITYSGALIPYLKVRGGSTLNNYEKIISENPYVLPGLDVSNTRTRIEGEIGAKGKFSTLFAYRLKASYAMIDSMYFFVNSTEAINDRGTTNKGLLSNFDVQYDNISKITVGLELSAKYNNLDVLFFTNYIRYRMDTLENAWHKPNVEAGLHTRYKTGAFIFTLNTQFRGKTPVLLPVGYGAHTTSTKAYVNLGLSAEYRITEKISVFLEGNNLLNRHYQDYYLYYHPGIIAGGGLTFSF
jgi:outer membrane receptor protein involved in Fe transport